MSDNAWRRALEVGVIAPIAVCMTGVAVQLAVQGDLPDPVAVHWGPDGPDGVAPGWLPPTLTLVLGGGLPVLLGASGLRSIRRGERGFILRLMPAMACALAVLLGMILTGSLVIQRGLADAADAPSVVPVMLGGLAAAVAAGVVGWLVQPRHVEILREASPVEPIARGAGERAVWLGRAEMSTPALAAIAGGVAVAVLAAAATWVAGDVEVAAVISAIAILLMVLAASFTVFHVRVDAGGLTVRSAARLIRLTVPAADVASVGTTTVAGLAQYGGFGIRSIPGATAVVLRSGPALEVVRRSGRRFVVTMERPEAAASVLAAVAEDARAAQD